MDIMEIRELMRTRSIYDIPMRVTFYARVSSDTSEQLNSLGNQIEYYEDLIKKNKAWTYVPGYIDEGISGISTKKRERFNQMIEDAHEDLFDLIITKEISRFARNTLDSLKYTRELLSCGVGVFFQNDAINTLDEDSELRLSIMSSIAQDELRKLSSRIKFGDRVAIKSGVVFGNSRIFGYKKNDGKLFIDEEQAPMVRKLYEMYATNEYSLKQLEKIFYDMGYRNYNEKRIAHTTLSGIISNPKYKGYYVGNKVKIIDMFTKKQKFLPPEEWVMYKDETGEIVPAIVSEELWDKANEVLLRRSEDVKNRKGICNHSNLLTGKLYCAHCGMAYYRKATKDKQGNINNQWVCSGKINNGSDSCPSFTIYEKEIIPILFDVFKSSEVDIKALIDEYVKMYESIIASKDIEKEIEATNEKIDLVLRKKAKILEYNIKGQIDDNEYIKTNKALTEEEEKLQEELRGLENEMYERDGLKDKINDVRSALQRATEEAQNGIITRDFIDRYIDKIIVDASEKNVAKLNIKINTGKSFEKELKKLKRRTGVTIKKMIESYENSIKTR